jgi:hypothetical protein
VCDAYGNIDHFRATASENDSAARKKLREIDREGERESERGTERMRERSLLPKWGTLGRAQDRASAASRNDVWVRSPRPLTDYIKKNGIFANPVRGGCDQSVLFCGM